MPDEAERVFYITDPDEEFALSPAFSVDPSFCTYEITGPTSDPTVPTEICDANESCFKIPELPDLGPVTPVTPGPLPPCVEYPVTHEMTVTAKDGSETT